MTSSNARSEVRTAAIAVLALLCIGPVGTGLDLLFNFLPSEFSATQSLHSATTVALVLWLGSALAGVLAVFLHTRRRAVPAFLATVLFACIYVPGANMVWLQFTFGCWLALVAVALAAFGFRKHET
jgi:hypothetical protein